MIKWLEKNRGISLIIIILISIEIFYFSSIPGASSGEGGNIWFSRIYHFSIFFLFSFFFFITIKGNKKMKTKYIFIVIIISIFYGITDEIHQLFVPFRNFSINDILTNNLGIFSSMIIYFIYKSKIKQQS